MLPQTLRGDITMTPMKQQGFLACYEYLEEKKLFHTASAMQLL